VPTVLFITHPDVVIDPGVPVPDWPLNERGRARMHAMTTCPWVRGVRRIFASNERKARDAAQILADGLRLSGYSVIANLGENDRSATGFLAKDEFEVTVDAFFARPAQSIRGWEPAANAQARIVSAVEQAVSQTREGADIALVGTVARGPCSIATSRGCRSIAVTISPPRMAATGSASTKRAENFCVMAGSRSTQRQWQSHEPARPNPALSSQTAACCSIPVEYVAYHLRRN